MKPIFISGHIKTGTSLMASLLDSHPELEVFPEEMFLFSKYSHFKRNGYQNTNEFWDIFFEDIQIKKMFNDKSEGLFGNVDYSEFDAEKFQNYCRNGLNKKTINQEDIFRFFETIFLSYLKTLDKNSNNRWVEKTPMNEFHFFYWITHFPEAKFIYMRRNPYDVFTSIKKKRQLEGVSYSVYTFLVKYLTSNKLADFLEKNYPKNFKIINLSELQNNKLNITKDICSFLEIKHHKALQTPTKLGKEWRGNSMFSKNKNQKIEKETFKKEREKLLNDKEKKIISKYILQNKKPFFDFNFVMFNFKYYLKVLFINTWLKKFTTL